MKKMKIDSLGVKRYIRAKLLPDTTTNIALVSNATGAIIIIYGSSWSAAFLVARNEGGTTQTPTLLCGSLPSEIQYVFGTSTDYFQLTSLGDYDIKYSVLYL